MRLTSAIASYWGEAAPGQALSSPEACTARFLDLGVLLSCFLDMKPTRQ